MVVCCPRSFSVRLLAPLCLASCASATTPAREPEPGRATDAAVRPVPETEDAGATQDVAVPPIASGGTACAEVRVGLDLRALPEGSGAGGIDLFVRGQASDLVGSSPADARPEIRTTPGVGVFDVVFRGAMESDAVSRCEQAVAAYLASSPRLPITMEPAAHVVTPCSPCQP